MAKVWKGLGVEFLGKIESPGKLEGGDYFTINQSMALVAQGLRTNAAGIQQLLDNVSLPSLFVYYTFTACSITFCFNFFLGAWSELLISFSFLLFLVGLGGHRQSGSGSRRTRSRPGAHAPRHLLQRGQAGRVCHGGFSAIGRFQVEVQVQKSTKKKINKQRQ